MITDLLWMRTGRPIGPTLALSGIPSWSWISCAGRVDLGFWHRVMGKTKAGTVNDHVKVVDASITWAGEPLVSDLRATNLIVEGPAQQFRLRVDPRARDFNPPYMDVNDEEADFSKSPIPWRCAGQFDLEREREDALFTCLLVRSVSSGDPIATYSLQETFLLLLPEPSSEGETYRRVGIAMFRGHTPGFASAQRKRISLI